jgi:ABC-type nickel/cobalt efflux system permease component RcnA
MNEIVNLQRSIRAALGGELGAFAASGDWLALAAVLPLGLVFGALHALTPGHGKTVLALYLVGARASALRGLAVAGALAVTHVASAVVVTLVATSLVSRSLSDAGRAPLLEDLSRALVALIGVWFLYRALRPAHRPRPRAHPLAGVVTGLAPCPLTLFVMVFAIGRGVPEAGAAFAIAMMAGIASTLAALAGVVVVLRERLVRVLERRGAAIATILRGSEGLAGLALVVIGLRQLLW